MDLENKKVCITGGSGFLGTNIVDYFKSKNVEVFVPKHKDYDLTKLEDAKKMIDDSGARIVIHAAADVGGLGYITKNTASIFRNNLNMTINILEASAYVEKLVLLGSACAYPGDSLYLSGGKLKAMRAMLLQRLSKSLWMQSITGINKLFVGVLVNLSESFYSQGIAQKLFILLPKNMINLIH